METLKLCGVAVLASFCALIMRELKRDFDIPIRLAATVLLMGASAAMAVPLISYLGEVSGASTPEGSMEILVRALAVALTVKISADICRECGASGVASALEVAGKLEVLLLAIPLLRRATEMVGELVG